MSNNNVELINTALKQRIGLIVSNYEEELASIRAEAAVMIERLTQENAALSKENARFKGLLEETSENVAVQEK